VVPFGKAVVVRGGRDVTIVATGNMVSKFVAAADLLEKEGVFTEILDPRTLVPLDKDAILASVARTGRLAIADERFETCGPGAEITAIVANEGFHYLKAPIQRVSMAPTPHPFSPPLEQAVLPTTEKIMAAVRFALGQ